jgi:predicted membrane protein
MGPDFENRPRGTERRYPNGEKMPDEEIPEPDQELHEDAPHIPGSARFFPAIVLVGVGAIFLLSNLGLLQISAIWRFWPLILLVLGVFRLSSREKGAKESALVMLIVGAVFLLLNLHLLHISFGILWPLILVGVGLLMLTRTWGGSCKTSRWADKDFATRLTTKIKARSERHWARSHPFESRAADSAERTDPAGGSSSFDDADNTLQNWAVFGGVSRVITSQNFRGGELFSFFGGIEIDLRRAQIVNNGRPVVIEANAVFGGISIKVPDTWRIAVRGIGVFGGYQDEDKRVRHPDPSAPLLVVSGYAAFGGVVIE